MRSIYLKSLPFYWRVRARLSDKSPVPGVLPLALAYDVTNGLFIQERNKHVLSCLQAVYKEKPNIGHNQEKSNWKNFYGDDFYSFLCAEINKRHTPAHRILEIGCGGCAILARLKRDGYQVLGIDPSPFSREEGAKKGITVIEDFFPSKKISGTFDVIYHSNVLEHIDRPLTFLKQQYQALNKGGSLMFAVPDCTGPIHHGDSSFLYHQHLTYFDKESLARLVRRIGFGQVNVFQAGFGGNLYCVAQKIGPVPHKRKVHAPSARRALGTFMNKHAKVYKALAEHIQKILADNKRSLGFYAPLRALPYIAEMNLKSGFRFFDDTSYWHHKYFDGIDVKFENFEDLKKHPVTDVLIMSPTFTMMIKKKIKAHFGNAIRVRSIVDLYA